jgi:outer membrane lipoprotein-sorting protein
MKPCLIIAAALFVPVCAHAQAAKPCEDLKSEIAKKMEANGVKSYTLEIVAKDKDAEGKVVGTCEGGTKKIVYRRGTTPAETATTQPDKK